MPRYVPPPDAPAMLPAETPPVPDDHKYPELVFQKAHGVGLEEAHTFEDALREVNRKPSPAIFAELARSVSTRRCTDPAFLKFKEALQTWFPAD